MEFKRPITRRYPNGEITVIWKPHLCIHSGICFAGLPRVFDPRRRPWVDPRAAASERIVEQVESCPSGALSWARDEAKPAPAAGDPETG